MKRPPPDTPPPHSPEHEAGALGCVLQDASTALPVLIAGKCGAPWFYDGRHKTVWRAAVEMDSAGKPVSVATLYAEDRENLERNGCTLQFLGELEGASPSAANAGYYVEPLRKFAIKRTAIEAARRITAAAHSETAEIEALLSDCDTALAVLRNGENSDELPAIVCARDFAANSLPRPAELVRGILHQGSKMQLGGGSKGFKTWTLLDLALSVATGAHWIGFATEQGRVLYVNLEVQPWGLQARLHEIAKAKRIEVPETLDLWNLRGKAAGYRVLLPKIIARAQNRSYALVILDPVYKLYGGQTDENAAGDVAELLNAIERLTVETGAAVAFGAHFSKGNQSGKEAIDRVSGSGVFARDPDTIVTFTKHQQEGAFTVETTLRNFAPVEPFVVRWQFPLMHADDSLDPAKLKQAGGRKPLHVPDGLLALLPDSGLDNKQWREAAQEEGIKERTYYNLRRELEDEGRVIKSNVNGKFQPVKKR